MTEQELVEKLALETLAMENSPANREIVRQLKRVHNIRGADCNRMQRLIWNERNRLKGIAPAGQSSEYERQLHGARLPEGWYHST